MKSETVIKQNIPEIEISKEYQEFLDETSERTKYEWIDGKLVLHSPVTDLHGSINLKLTLMLNSYVIRNNLGHLVSGNALINFEFAVNNFKSDAVFFLPKKAKFINNTTSLYNVIPDFIVKIASKGTRNYDRNIKYKVYQQHGVSEYWIIEPFKKTVEQFILHNGKYKSPIFYKIEDTIKSHIVKGFKIKIKALYEDIFYLAELDKHAR